MNIAQSCRQLTSHKLTLMRCRWHLRALLPAAGQSSKTYWATCPPQLRLLGGATYPTHPALHRQTSLWWLHTVCKLVRLGCKKTWRGTHAEHNAFESCAQLALPKWIRLLPKPTDGLEEWADFRRSCAEENCCRS